ncbi:hypothetical protein AK830_g6955 [Neonectria ditissima]|uniref:Uncharacterized protein n=1 Tax=Neonectria ditissima TaxID=78410 RepID=A0A0P7AP46_9HYPO|nr:hypothetical protein AK830_g6955 [Neonectria ditissima]
METLLAERNVKSHLGSRLPTTAKLLARTKRKRPTISEPVGPIKNSRGPDFVRSENLVIVPGIKDCGSDESLLDKEVEAKQTTRRISASFQKQGLPSSHPTIAKSEFSVTASCQKGLPQRILPQRLPKTMSMTSATKAWLTSSSSFDIIPSLDTIPQDENAPPLDHGALPPKQPTVLPKSQLPKSRTMSVLTDLKSSFSRPSLASRCANSRAFSGRKTSQPSSTSTLVAASSSHLRLPQSSLTSLSKSSRSTTPETPLQLLPGQINTAQPSAYWSGRFVALHDRFLAESLN